MLINKVCQANLDDVVDAPNEREKEEDHHTARVIVFALLHLGQVKSLCRTLTTNNKLLTTV